MLGIKNKIKKMFSKFYTFDEEFKRVNPIFDMRFLDKKIGEYASSIISCPVVVPVLNQNNIAFLASEIWDTGGHTGLLNNTMQAFPSTFKRKLFLTKKTLLMQRASVRVSSIEGHSEIDGVDFYSKNIVFEKFILKKLLNKILEFSPTLLIVFIHFDSFAVGLLALLKKYTHIKIIFCNHSTQHSVLGMSFAHLIWECMSSTAFVTQKYRGFRNTYTAGICYLKKEQFPVFSEREILNARQELGVPEDSYCTMTGCNSYKLFDGNSSPYLEMIKKILEQNENLWHVLITCFNEDQKKIFEEINMPNRFVLLSPKTNYKVYFKCADVFIDSIPFASANTIIDLMSLKVPVVAYKNKDNLIFSFHEYLPSNYSYLFENTCDVQAGVEKLLFNENERKRIANENYEYLLKNFEGNTVTQKLLEANSFDSEINENQYKNFKEIKLLPWGKRMYLPHKKKGLTN